MTPGSTTVVRRPVSTAIGNLKEKLIARKIEINAVINLGETAKDFPGEKQRYLMLVSSPEVSRTMKAVAPSLEPWILPVEITLTEVFPGETMIAVLNPVSLICKYYNQALLLPAAQQFSNDVEACLAELHKEDPVIIERVTSWQ